MRSAPDFLTLTRTTEPPRRAGWRRDAAPRPCLLPDSIELADDCTSLPDDHRYEPALAASPFIVEFDELDRLDPERAELPTEATAVASPATRPIRGPIGSLLVHLLVICLILAPSLSPPDIASADPDPAGAGDPAAAQAGTATGRRRRPSRRAGSPRRISATSMRNPATAAAEAKEESVAKPAPAPDLIPPPPPPKPPPPREQVTALATPKVPPPLLTQPAPTPQQAARRPAEETHAAAHLAHVPGPSATRDEYLAYLVTPDQAASRSAAARRCSASGAARPASRFW